MQDELKEINNLQEKLLMEYKEYVEKQKRIINLMIEEGKRAETHCVAFDHVRLPHERKGSEEKIGIVMGPSINSERTTTTKTNAEKLNESLNSGLVVVKDNDSESDQDQTSSEDDYF